LRNAVSIFTRVIFVSGGEVCFDGFDSHNR